MYFEPLLLSVLFCFLNFHDQGVAEAKQAAVWLKENDYTFDVAYTSVLKRYIIESLLWLKCSF